MQLIKIKKITNKTKKIMRTLNFTTTLRAIQNLVNNNFSAVFAAYSSVEIDLDLYDEICEYIKFAEGNKMLFGVSFGKKALSVLASEDFIRQDIDRQFEEEDEENSIEESLSLEREKAEELAWEDRYYSAVAHAYRG